MALRKPNRAGVSPAQSASPAQDRLVRSIASLDVGVRALLELSLHTGLPDDELSTMVEREPWELALERSAGIAELSAIYGETGPDGQARTAAALEALTAERWAEARRLGEPQLEMD